MYVMWELGRYGLTFLGGGRVNRVQGSVRGITYSRTLSTDGRGSSGVVYIRCARQSAIPKGPKCATARMQAQGSWNYMDVVRCQSCRSEHYPRCYS